MKDAICPDCGSVLELGEEETGGFCPKCQTSWSICPHCNKAVPPDSPAQGWENCPHCGRSMAKIECPVCKEKIFADSKKCPKCQTKFRVCICPECGNKVIASPKVELCPICETFIKQRCGHCKSPTGHRGMGEKCSGCGRFL